MQVTILVTQIIPFISVTDANKTFYFSSMIVSGGRDGLVGLWDTQELSLIKLIDYKDKNLVFQVSEMIF